MFLGGVRHLSEVPDYQVPDYAVNQKQAIFHNRVTFKACNSGKASGKWCLYRLLSQMVGHLTPVDNDFRFYFWLFTNPHFQTFNALKSTHFEAFQIIQTFSHRRALTPLIMKYGKGIWLTEKLQII